MTHLEVPNTEGHHYSIVKVNPLDEASFLEVTAIPSLPVVAASWKH
jgi:hypothetical protein